MALGGESVRLWHLRAESGQLELVRLGNRIEAVAKTLEVVRAYDRVRRVAVKSLMERRIVDLENQVAVAKFLEPRSQLYLLRRARLDAEGDPKILATDW